VGEEYCKADARVVLVANLAYHQATGAMMSQETRQEQICRLIAERGECSVEELVRQLGVSGMTIRRDLAALAQQGRVLRTHGGAALAERFSFEFAFRSRLQEQPQAKEAIGRAAAARIENGQTVLLDSGTTTLALAWHLHGKQGLTVITTSLPIAAELQYDRQLQVLLLGGYLRPESPDLGGALTEANLETLHADLAFLGTDSVDARGTVYNQSPEVARMLTKMAAAATTVYVVADGSKLGKTALWRFGLLQDWAGLITDRQADAKILASLRKAGVQVVRAE
jgi:DeoR family transcriptional regulator of aga operon